MLYIILAAILGVTNYFGNKLKKLTPHTVPIVSAAAGMSIAYLFLALLPLAFRGVDGGESVALMLVLTGFVVVHVLEKYQLKKGKTHTTSSIHLAAFSLYNFALGLAFFALSLEYGSLPLVLFFIPSFLHTVLGEAALEDIPEKLTIGNFKITAVVAPLVGALLPTFFEISPNILNSIFAITVGAILYITIRDELPKGAKGDIRTFILGVVVYTLIIMTIGSSNIVAMISKI